MKKIIFLLIYFFAHAANSQDYSIARAWNEEVLHAIRNDFARPTVHARNLFHTSMAMYDIWAVFDENADTFFLGKSLGEFNCAFDGFYNDVLVEENRKKAISYAIYRIVQHRFSISPGVDDIYNSIDSFMDELGYNKYDKRTDYHSGDAAALGNYVAQQIIEFGLQDNSNEQNDYANLVYEPLNGHLITDLGGNPNLSEPNHWQPLTVEEFIDQSGNYHPGGSPEFLSPEWGKVIPFSLGEEDLSIHSAPDYDYWVYHDPNSPSYIQEGIGLEDPFKWGFTLVSIWGSHLDPNDDVMIDISPASIGNISSFPETFEEYKDFYNFFDGGDPSSGWEINPNTGLAYEEQMVPRGDYGRVLAEFWADGPDSETPPGHWFTILNYVNDHPEAVKKFKGEGEILSSLEWDIKSYFILSGAMHDSAIAAWGIKGYYDYIRPVSAIRFMAEKGQSTDPSLPNYHPAGLPLVPGFIEMVDDAHPLSDFGGEDHVGDIAIRTWKGPDYIEIPQIDEAGVDWILAENWWPYQRPSFVTPPFAGYFSGHSAFSRAAAEQFEMLTGSAYWPGGLAEWPVNMNQFLVFEDGPSMTFNLQWATFMDASNESALSRIWGGIHPPVDDAPARYAGMMAGKNAFHYAETIVFPDLAMEFGGTGFIPSDVCVGDFNADGQVGSTDFLLFLSAYGLGWTGAYDMDNSSQIGASDLLILLQKFGQTC